MYGTIARIQINPTKIKELGYGYGMLFSTEMGVRVYECIGFRLTKARINRYLWRNE